MAVGSTVQIKKNGTDITSHVMYRDATFESQMNAVPGTFSFRCKDLDQNLSFTTGDIITLTVDGVIIYGGYIMNVGREYAFDADHIPTDSTAYDNRIWNIRGIDYNTLLDRRILHNVANHLTQIPTISTIYDGDVIRGLTAYLDLPSYIDVTTHVDNIHQFATYAYKQQGSKWRETLDELRFITGAIVYLDGQGFLHYNEIDSAVKRWGFSDKPNHNTITTAPGYQGATIGMREINGAEDGSHFVNDAFIWGGSMFAGAGGTVFARVQNTTSITDHGRWQLAETHFGEQEYKTQSGVDLNADIIVNGSPGAVGADQNRGLRFPQWQFRLGWYAHDVPLLSGNHDHLIPGELSTFNLWVFSEDGGVTPLTQLLPLRSVRISFPTLDKLGNGYVRFDGFFGLQPDDPYTLWSFILKQIKTVQSIVLTAVNSDSPAAPYGSYGYFTPTPVPDGSTADFTVPFPYIPGSSSLRITHNSVTTDQVRGSQYTESDPDNGVFHTAVPPQAGDTMVFICRTA